MTLARRDDAGTFLHALSILRDIRSLKELQDKLVHASRLASLGEFAASIAHDVINPLSTIRLAGVLLPELTTVSSGVAQVERPTPADILDAHAVLVSQVSA